MPSLINSAMENGTGPALGAAAWGYLFFFCSYWSKRIGSDSSEPPYWLYGSTFGAIRWISLAAFLGLGWLLGSDGTLLDDLFERLLPIGLAIVAFGPAAAVALGLLEGYRRLVAVRLQADHEPMSPGRMIIIICAVAGGLGIIAGGAWTLREFFNVEIPEPQKLISELNVGILLALVTHFVLFWIIPIIMADRFEEQDLPTVWAKSTGLEYFRWAWLGLSGFAFSGIAERVPGLESMLEYPLGIATAVAFPLGGAALFALFWVLPMVNLAGRADAGDVLAEDFLPAVRFSGAVAWASCFMNRRGEGSRYGPEEARHVCTTCLRSTGHIEDYKNFTFDACPHCKAFIPPVFEIRDLVKHFAARASAMLEDSSQGSSKRKKRGEDSQQIMTDLLRGIIALAVSERGTDLHFVLETDRVLVRCRTDGVLFTMFEFDPAMARPLISVLKVLAKLDIAERRKPQDGSFKQEIGGTSVDLRINTSPVADGETATARLLYLQDVLGSVEGLGMAKTNLKLFTELIHRPSGLILVSGPTGSGKSTTLYNALQTIATGERNIITLEDPIEYEMDGMTQMQVNEAKGFGFSTGLRSILRQDPDVIMVGEIRDQETAKMAIDAAATGHLVFSTLHAVDSIMVTSRLADLGVDIGRYAAVLLLVLAQRLMRLNCPKCLVDQVVTREELESHGLRGIPEESYTLKRGTGCSHCRDSGFYGREGIFEFFVPNDELKNLMSENTPITKLRQLARAQGMRTLGEDGLVKVMQGKTTIDELMRVVS